MLKQQKYEISFYRVNWTIVVLNVKVICWKNI